MTLNFESDTMTVKRLEIALQKEDAALLKTAGYKLHEKFHAGHKFEYLPQLKQILNYIENEKLEGEFYRLISLTIKEILAAQEGDAQSPSQAIPQQTAQTLPPIQPALIEEPLVQAPPPPQNTPAVQDMQRIQPPEGLFSSHGPEVNTTKNKVNSIPDKVVTPVKASTISEPPENPSGGDIFIYWEEKSSEIDSQLLNDYRKAILSDAPLSEFLTKFKTISNILDLDLSNLSKIFSTMAALDSPITFATASLNSNVWERIKESGGSDWDFLPIWDQINFFKCIDCENKFLGVVKTPAAQCQSCGGNAFAQFNLNPLNLQRALDALMNSKTWILINPPMGSPETETMFSIAFKNAKPDKICLLTHDGERKTHYRDMFYGADVKSDYASIESFCEEFGRPRASVWG